MKNNEYYIVHKSILPSYFEQIILTRELINDKKYSVSDACKESGISRSTYYKYKDYIFRPNKDSGTKALFVLKTFDVKGILSSILQVVYASHGNIISINQDSPIDGTAHISISIDVSEMDSSVEELKMTIEKLDGIKSVDIMGVE
ncbi:MAG: ACT domain-containing protein [Bacilli bacterium]|nr:ACT domain-containing protein [Bacilli bacterium]